jgi:hypothetical protein
MDGDVIEADAELEYTVHFDAKRAEITEGRPYRIKYSLTLHDKHGSRLLGFDNAHEIEDKVRGRFSKHRKVSKWDHEHKFKDVSVIKPYDYQTAEQLLVDFWAAVDSAIELEKKRL